MQPIIILEFLGGVIGGAFLSVLILKYSSHKRNSPAKLRTIKVASSKKSKTLPLIRAEPKQRKRRARASKVTRSNLPKEARVEPSLLEGRTSFLSCPSCGLEAPESLMIEHLMGSPSHRYGPAKPQTVVSTAIDRGDSTRKSSSDESADSVRHLLQMLVPPRAFGRRHKQRVINPLSNIVRAMGPGRDQ